jgi:hypothetical protein
MVVRFFVFTAIALLATKDLMTAIIAVIAVMVAYQTLNLHKITDTVLDKTQQMIDSTPKLIRNPDFSQLPLPSQPKLADHELDSDDEDDEDDEDEIDNKPMFIPAPIFSQPPYVQTTHINNENQVPLKETHNPYIQMVQQQKPVNNQTDIIPQEMVVPQKASDTSNLMELVEKGLINNHTPNQIITGIKQSNPSIDSDLLNNMVTVVNNKLDIQRMPKLKEILNKSNSTIPNGISLFENDNLGPIDFGKNKLADSCFNSQQVNKEFKLNDTCFNGNDTMDNAYAQLN